jgi:hypothetical protein
MHCSWCVLDCGEAHRVTRLLNSRFEVNNPISIVVCLDEIYSTAERRILQFDH